MPYSTDDWALSGGYKLLTLWREDTEEVLTTSAVAPAAYAPEEDRRELSDGTLDPVARVRPVDLLVVGWGPLRTLRRWRDDGAVVRGRLFASGRGSHLLWDEPVPVLLRDVNEGRGGLSGAVLTLYTARAGAAVLQTPDLIGERPFTAAEWTATTTGDGVVVWPSPSAHPGTGDEQVQLYAGAGASAAVWRDVAAPAPGAALAFSVEGLPTDPSASFVVEAAPLTYAEYVLGTGPSGWSYVSVGSPVGTGAFTRLGVAVQMPGASFGVRVRVRVPEETTATVRVPLVTTVDAETGGSLRVGQAVTGPGVVLP